MKAMVSATTVASDRWTFRMRVRAGTRDFVFPASHQKNQQPRGMQKSKPSKGLLLARSAIPSPMSSASFVSTLRAILGNAPSTSAPRSEEHTSELQSHVNL